MCKVERRWHKGRQMGSKSGRQWHHCQLRKSIRVSMALQGQCLAPSTLSTSCSPHSPGLRGTGGKGAPAVWPKPSPPSPLEPSGSELCRGSGREGAFNGSSQSAIFTQQSLILTKQLDFFKKRKEEEKKTWFQNGNNQAASSSVWKNTLVPKTLFFLKGENVDAPARGINGCSESKYLTQLPALTHPHTWSYLVSSL